jgi:hypothetical protein
VRGDAAGPARLAHHLPRGAGRASLLADSDTRGTPKRVMDIGYLCNILANQSRPDMHRGRHTSTRAGSPPNACMLSRTQRRASRWSACP